MRRRVEESQKFIRDFAGGVRSQDVRRLFHADAPEAYRVLARDETAPEPQQEFSRFLHRAKVLFLGIAYRLTPARRLLFVGCLLATAFGALDLAPEFINQRLVIEASGFWFLVAISGLVFLLVLELVDQVRVRDELEVARDLQLQLLPLEAPEHRDWRIAHSWRTANTVGGDYYDFLELPDGRLALLVGDASGHGLAAGLVMAIAHASLRLAMDENTAPEPVLEVINRALYRTGGRRDFMSLFYSVLDRESGALDWASAGHPYPLLRRANGTVLEVGDGALPLGLRVETVPATGRITLEPGDTLVLFSDGLPEAVDESGRAFSYQRLRELLRNEGSADEIHARIHQELERHLGENRLEDDFSLVVVRRLRVPPPPPR